MAKTPKRSPLSPDRIEKVWEKGQTIRGKDPDLYRRDQFGNELYKPSLGKAGPKSWEVDHVKPLSKGGSDNLRNLQPLQTDMNREKADKYPFKPKT